MIQSHFASSPSHPCPEIAPAFEITSAIVVVIAAGMAGADRAMPLRQHK